MNEPFFIKSSGKEILTTGSVHTFDLSNIELILSDLKFIIQFSDDGGKQRMESSVVSDKGIMIQLFNFNNPLGIGLTSPQKIGTYKNKELYFIFTIYALNKSSVKLLHYTFYSGDNINTDAGRS
ncbi:MAG: hypothetical protein PHV17_06510 [Candidatus Omnitrophica bacterium]|nr:hypothetical protein [Candidatus Omnitrophota bacterium]